LQPILMNMEMKKTLTMLALMLPMLAFAQWRVGV
jgi:hypothetical protein